jgi:hypothetical protein
MKDTVTFETAVRLKEAGFPQPTPEAGQWWYNPNGILFVVYLVHELVELHELGRRNTSIGHYWEDWTFAPTATDILRELSSDCVLGTKKLGGWICGSWRLISSDYMKFFVAGMHDENPAEAAASAWLKLQEEE